MNNFILSFIPESLRDNHDTFRRARLIIGISLIFDIFALYYMFLYITMQLMINVVALGISVLLSMSVPLVLRFSSSLKVSGNFMCLMLLMTFSTIVIFEGGPASYSKYWFGTIPMVAMLFNGLASGRNWVITLIIWNILLFLDSRLEWVQYPNTLLGMTPPQQLIKGLLSVIGIVSVGYFIIRLYETEKNRMLEKINALRDESAARAKSDYQQLAALKIENEMIAAENVSHIAAMNTQLNNRNQELERLNIEKNEFLGIAAHDLKNPLTSIVLLSEMVQLQHETLDSVQLLEKVSKIELIAMRMRDIIANVLDVSALESGTLMLYPAGFDAALLIKNIVNEYADRASEKNISLYVDVPKDYAIDIYADFAKTYEVVENLLSNAIKYSPHGKNVFIRIIEDAATSTVRIEVQDEGPGISDEDMKRLFGKFAKLSAQPTGGEDSTGLGLSIVKKIVEAMNGRAWCESVFGEGATFIVALPRA
jgi:signal transduction histidine kinase